MVPPTFATLLSPVSTTSVLPEISENGGKFRSEHRKTTGLTPEKYGRKPDQPKINAGKKLMIMG